MRGIMLLYALLGVLLLVPWVRIEPIIGRWVNDAMQIASLVCVLAVVGVYIEITIKGLKQLRQKDQ